MLYFMRAIRWVWPALSLAGGLTLLVHNMDPKVKPWMLPGLEWFTEGRKVEAGQLSWQILLAFFVISLVYAIVMFITERPDPDLESVGGRPPGMAVGKDTTFGDADLDRLVKFDSRQEPTAGKDDDGLVKFD